MYFFDLQVSKSPQAKKHFQKCCSDASQEVLELVAFCKTRFQTWELVLKRFLELDKV